MKKPLLSICIPTRNRAEYLLKTLNNITSDKIFVETDNIEIVVSDNCSDDNTKEVCDNFLAKFPSKIKYYRQDENIGDKNFVFVLKKASGIFAKLNNDTLYYRENALDNILEILRKNETSKLIFFTNINLKHKEYEISKYNCADEYQSKLTYRTSWIGGVCVKKSEFDKISEPDRFADINFSQTDFTLRLANTGENIIVDGKFMEVFPVSNKGGYNVAKIFGQNYNTVLLNLLNDGIISEKTYQKSIKDMLTKQINVQYFDLKHQFSFDKDGYFKYLFDIYKKHLYFYLNFLIWTVVKPLKRKFYKRDAEGNYRIYVFFSFIKIKRRLKNNV